ncbi:hypothetical protein QBC47DRAFT_297180 [Echria macrotheca]|uniref:Exonuclease 1 n=1 Tax=Echria macrotheca TaxID=438768 RepID=A0AAJ0BFB4_9PEZI|nr:hypothetical protein QBC47DRAFT_297180 [Echria macrotheca]
MLCPGLLPLLKSIHRQSELKKYAGQTLGVDGYVWLHRGAMACAMELAQGKPTRKYVDYAMHRVKMFKHFGVTPYLVFDGDYLPSKAGTESSREQRREDSRKAGLELLKAGKPAQALPEFQKAIDVTPEMARHLIEDLKKANLPYVVAPYEADAQLVYLERQGLINGIVSEDSDLLVFGAKRLLTKLDQYGHCIEINRKDFCSVREISLTGWTDADFRRMAILSGCDYLDGPSNMGLKTAYRMLRKYKTPERLIKMLQFDGKFRMPDDYLAKFQQAELTFLYQRVFCPTRQEIVLLTDPDPSIDIESMPFIGAPVKPEVARLVAAGDVNPITKRRILVPTSPGKRRISQVSAASQAPPAKKSLGKPIDEYFGDRRIPLGEMDPNCFMTKPHGDNGGVEEEPRPIVFPLPRPYLEETSGPSRPYKSGSQRRKTVPLAELIGLEEPVVPNRRHTLGPTVQVFQDSTATRPPKKARLCEDADLPVMKVDSSASERSKFFPAKKKRPASRKSDSFLMSDDSIDEVFRSIPDFDIWPPAKPTRQRTSGILDGILPVGGTERDPVDLSREESSPMEDEIEVPVSSPLRPSNDKPDESAGTPLGSILQKFSYSSTQRSTRIVYGLPTPSMSAEKPSSPATSQTKGIQTPRLTPLERIGAQALGRSGKASPSISRLPRSTNKRGKAHGLDPVDPASVPLPKVDLIEVEALNMVGSEDQIIPESDVENDSESQEASADAGVREGAPRSSLGRLDLSNFQSVQHFQVGEAPVISKVTNIWVVADRNREQQERLRNQASAFSGLLSLIPAKVYYGEDKNNDQWKRKKQSKDQAKAAKMGKLDPDSELNRSAKEELEERARNKRKLQDLEGEPDDSADDDDEDMSDASILDGVEREKPLEGLKVKKVEEPSADEPSAKKVKVEVEQTPKKKLTKEEKKSAKKQKAVEESQPEPDTSTTPSKLTKEEKKAAKKLKKTEKLKAKLEKTSGKTEAEEEEPQSESPDNSHVQESTEVDELDHDDDMAPIDVSGLVADQEDASEGPTERSASHSPVFDSNSTKIISDEPASTTTSISSAVPPSEKPRYIKLPTDTAAMRARLEAKLEALRAARKGKEEEGKQIRTRQELIEARREKQLKRRAHKKEMRLKAKEEEDRKREEALTSSRNSPLSMLSPMFNDPDDGRNANHFAFGRLAFSDGTLMSHDLSYEKPATEKKKGPSDPKTALAKLEAQKKRLAGLDEDKRKEVLEKETWLAARRRAEGEKVHNDEGLLKKAVKRKEKAKKKSEREWKERAQGVDKAIKDRQHKREENIRKRREEKLSKGKGKKKGGSAKRAGFEGSLGKRK